MSDLEKKFGLAMLDIYQRAKSEANYPANLFFGMLSDRGGLATAQYLINQDKPSDGYTNLYQRGRLDLTVEAVIFDNPVWHPLFTEEEMAKVKKRLNQYEYFKTKHR